MYVPKPFAVRERDAIVAFVERFDFAALITPTERGIEITHLPLLVDRRGDDVVLRGHVARANPHAGALASGRTSVATFQGPHGYVSPSWYRVTPSVPTWNYAVVHAHGVAAVLDDAAVLVETLDRLARKYEEHREAPWRLDAIPARHRDGLVREIVAVELRVERFEAKFKMSQNRGAADRASVRDALAREPSADATALADFMRALEPTSTEAT